MKRPRPARAQLQSRRDAAYRKHPGQVIARTGWQWLKPARAREYIRNGQHMDALHRRFGKKRWGGR